MSNNPDDPNARLRSGFARDAAPELPSDLVTEASARRAPRLVNPARRLQVAGGLTVAVAAVAITALVVTMPVQRAPLFTASGSGGGSSAESAASDLRIANWVDYEYVAGSSLSTTGGTGNVYQLKRVGTGADRAAEIATALGVVGDATKSEYFDDAYPSYVVGPEDSSGPSVYVSWAGTGDWSYSDYSADPAVECVPSGDDPLVCTVPDPVLADSLAPDEAAARSLAHDLFVATGLTVATEDITVTVDAWQTSASANLVVAGVATALNWSVAWSAATGTMSYAYGHSVAVVDMGSYDTASPTAAVDRLADWRWFGAAGPDYQGGMMYAASDLARSGDVAIGGTGGTGPDAPATDPSAPVDPTVPSDPEVPTVPAVPTVPTVPTGPAGEPTLDPAPVDPIPKPLPTPETVVVTVDTAESTLLLMWDSEGNGWLVPGFAMQQPEGWWNSVVSLEEGVIALPDPIEPGVEPSTVD